MSLASIIEELRRDARARGEFISEIMPDVMLRLALDKDLRMSLLRAIAGEVATKEDLKEFERRLKEYVDMRIDDLNRRIDDLDRSLNKRIDDVNKRIDDVNRNVRVTLIAILMTLLATIIVPLILRVLGIIT